MPSGVHARAVWRPRDSNYLDVAATSVQWADQVLQGSANAGLPHLVQSEGLGHWFPPISGPLTV
jgi:hypothetical protein